MRKSPIPSEQVQEIRLQRLILFSESIGYEFRIKGAELTDIVAGIDRRYEMVKGEKNGDFHVDICELTGRRLKNGVLI
jgi:hypothetical protein